MNHVHDFDQFMDEIQRSSCTWYNCAQLNINAVVARVIDIANLPGARAGLLCPACSFFLIILYFAHDTSQHHSARTQQYSHPFPLTTSACLKSVHKRPKPQNTHTHRHTALNPVLRIRLLFTNCVRLLQFALSRDSGDKKKRRRNT